MSDTVYLCLWVKGVPFFVCRCVRERDLVYLPLSGYVHMCDSMSSENVSVKQLHVKTPVLQREKWIEHLCEMENLRVRYNIYIYILCVCSVCVCVCVCV